MRNSYLSALDFLAKKNPQVLGLIADNGAIVYDKFRANYPKQFINFGISEANMVGSAAGLASCGKIPFAYTIIPFLTMRAYEFVRNDVCLQNQNVKLVGIGAGFAYSTLGPTHHAIEDIAAMRVLPNLTIISPASPLEAYKATIAAAELVGPVYLRLGTNKEPEVYTSDYEFQVGKGVLLTEGEDITLIATGSIVYDVVQVANELRDKGIRARVINMHTIKPLDKEVVLQAAQETGAVVTIEEHNIIGGLGGAVAEVLLENCCNPIIFERIGLSDCFCHGYGTHEEVKAMNGLSKTDIFKKVMNVYGRKGGM